MAYKSTIPELETAARAIQTAGTNENTANVVGGVFLDIIHAVTFLFDAASESSAGNMSPAQVAALNKVVSDLAALTTEVAKKRDKSDTTGFLSRDDADAIYVQLLDLDSALDNYMTNSFAYSTFVQIKDLSTQLKKYLTTTDADATYLKISELNSKLSQYLTTTEANSTFVAVQELNNTLRDYLTTAAADSTYVAIKDLSARLSGYLTKQAAMQTYSTRTEVSEGLAQKVNVEKGKSLVEDTEIARVKTLQNYDDKKVVADIKSNTDAINELKKGVRLSFSRFVEGVTVSDKLSEDDGELVYDKKVNLFLWAVYYDEFKSYAYFRNAKLSNIAGNPPQPGTIYECQADAYIGVDNGLSLQSKSEIIEIED